MKQLLIILILSFFWGCKQKKESLNIFSPEENVKYLTFQSVITLQKKIDSISQIIAFQEIDSLWIIGTKKGVYTINNKNKTLTNYFKFDIKSNHKIFDKQDSIVGYNFINIVLNKNRTKTLIETSNGIVFQINHLRNEIDWLTKFVGRIETATYSDNGEIIAIGTRYNKKNNTGYYSSLFMIDSKTGKYLDHFNENASIKKILFKNNDSELLVAYDWNYTDTYLWKIDEKEKSVAEFNEKDAFIYDILITDKDNFISVNGNGISKWQFKKPKDKKLIYSDKNTGSEQIFDYMDGYILIDYNGTINPPTFKYLNNDINVIDEFNFPKQFNKATFSKGKSELIGIEKDKYIHFFNLEKKTIERTIDIIELNEIITRANNV
jgi:hypothetical protein